MPIDTVKSYKKDKTEATPFTIDPHKISPVTHIMREQAHLLRFELYYGSPALLQGIISSRIKGMTAEDAA